MRYYCVVHMLTAGSNHPSTSRSYFPVSNVNTCEPPFQGHFSFMFLNTGYHCGPYPLLLESVFNQMKGLYWRIFLVGEKNKLIEKLITNFFYKSFSFPFIIFENIILGMYIWDCLFTSAMICLYSNSVIIQGCSYHPNCWIFFLPLFSLSVCMLMSQKKY